MHGGVELRIAYEPVTEASDELFGAWDEAVTAGAYIRRPPVDRATFQETWIDNKDVVIVARMSGAFAGSYFLRPAYPGAGAHVANAGYLVPRRMRRRGIGRALVEHSLATARDRGYDAMLFTSVLQSTPSGRLYTQLGFSIAGRVPDVVDGEACVLYWRSLDRVCSAPEPDDG